MVGGTEVMVMCRLVVSSSPCTKVKCLDCELKRFHTMPQDFLVTFLLVKFQSAQLLDFDRADKIFQNFKMSCWLNSDFDNSEDLALVR